VFGLIIALVVGVWLLFSSGGESRESIGCRMNLKMIHKGTVLWAAQHGGALPPSLQALSDGNLIESVRKFVCPGSASSFADGQFVCDYDSSFGQRLGLRLGGASTAQRALIAWDREPWHEDGGGPYRNALFLNGEVERLHAAEFAAEIKKLGHTPPE
jgi:hypothetical protein